MYRYEFNLEVINDSIKFENELTALVESYLMHSALNRMIISNSLSMKIFALYRDKRIEELVNDNFKEDGLSK